MSLRDDDKREPNGAYKWRCKREKWASEWDRKIGEKNEERIKEWSGKENKTVKCKISMKKERLEWCLVVVVVMEKKCTLSWGC